MKRRIKDFLFNIKLLKSNWTEFKYLVKGESCCVCDKFDWYMGSAGVCKAKVGCPITRMRDCSDSCNCDGFHAVKFKIN